MIRTLRVLFDLVVVVICTPIRWLIDEHPSVVDLGPDDPGQDVDGLSSHPEIDGVAFDTVEDFDEVPTRPICRCPHQDVLEPFDAHAPGCAVRLVLARNGGER